MSFFVDGCVSKNCEHRLEMGNQLSQSRPHSSGWSFRPSLWWTAPYWWPHNHSTVIIRDQPIYRNSYNDRHHRNTSRRNNRSSAVAPSAPSAPNTVNAPNASNTANTANTTNASNASNSNASSGNGGGARTRRRSRTYKRRSRYA